MGGSGPAPRTGRWAQNLLFAESGLTADDRPEKRQDRPFSSWPLPSRLPRPPIPKDFPLTLVFGNSLYYWNQNVLVRHSETLKREYRQLMIDYPEGFVEINPEDAK